MKKSTAPVFVSLLIALASSGMHGALAGGMQDTHALQGAGIEPQKIDRHGMKPNNIRTMQTRCYTSREDCAGLARFDNNSGTQGKCCAVYFEDGERGESNFCLPPGRSHTIHVRYRDTFVCAAGEGAPPLKALHSYIWVQ